MKVIALYIILLLGLVAYTYVLIDPNLTLVNASWWVKIRESLIYIGYYQREISTFLYVVVITLLFAFHFIVLKKYNRISAIYLSIIIGFLLVVSYPFLSRDVFNYMFDARILTYYGQNPYLHAPLEFSDDWLRFMHWTHRTYPYGPVFLPLTLIPSFLSAGKFILNVVFFKVFFIGFYLLGVYFLQKMNNKWALIFATHPLIIIEGLVNTHNDLIAVAFGIMGVYYLSKKQHLVARVMLILSAGIKYLTLPILFLTHNHKKINYIVIFLQILMIGYLGFFRDIQPWYFLTFFIFLPYYASYLRLFDIFFFGLLLSYIPYLLYGDWDEIWMKYAIILASLVINSIYIYSKKRFFSK